MSDTPVTEGRESLFSDADRELLRPVLDAENSLSQAIFLCDHFAEKQSNSHPQGDEFVTHYVVPHGLWAAVLREKQSLRHAIQTTIWPEPRRCPFMVWAAPDTYVGCALPFGHEGDHTKGEA